MKAAYKLLFGLLLVAVVGVGGWWAFSSQSGGELSNLSANVGAKLTDTQVQAVVSRISKFMVVPSDEKPSVVVLKDVQTLAQQQAFYRGAKDGDILIVYSTRAIIYDAEANKLVSVSPITQNTATPVPVSITASASAQTPAPSATPVPPEKVTIEVRNGTGVAGAAGKEATELKKNVWVTKTTTGDAKILYKATVLIDVSGGKNPGAIAALEKILGVTAVTEIPKGEVSSTANILVILGK